MTDNMVICNKLDILINYYNEFIKLTDDLDFEKYNKDIIIKRAIERQIQLIVECATDINNMILKKINKGPSKDYFNSFIDLSDNNIISTEFALKIAPSTGLRNILVHEYQKINDTIVYKSIKNIKDLYKTYIKIIVEYLECDQP